MRITNEKHIVIYRLSAMGDVAMLAQAVRNAIESNPDIRITLVTRPLFHPFFGEHDRLNFFPLDLNGRHKGFTGLLKLANDIKALKPAIFIDEHDVLRSKIVRSSLKLSGVKTVVFNKGRNEKSAMLMGQTEFKQLTHSIDRYNAAIKLAGLKTSDDFQFILTTSSHEFKTGSKKKTIGFAPFAAHDSKEWGDENVKAFLNLIEKEESYEVLLFGGGKTEEKKLKALTFDFSCCRSVAGQYSLEEELAIMQSCDVFLAMDSSNMHLADLVGCKVISIWIATHPYFGFFAWNNKANCIVRSPQEYKHIPLSIYGKLNSENEMTKVEEIRKMIPPEKVLEKVNLLLD
ncbi:glycosyltransferase family 9 protein [Parvicella tangerina]|uniref:glycosyltransferase family 9 protein n=1 Tax=Parvicella tangerina TaxID=2829795 RepID=UPI00215BD01D|nr:glycosyltransferase family 9 protein [Parvicella tangerina]